MVSRQGGLSTGFPLYHQRVGNSHGIPPPKKMKKQETGKEGRTRLKSRIFQFHAALWLHEKVWEKKCTADKSSDNYVRPHHPCAGCGRGRVREGWCGVAQKELVGNWNLTSCQPHRVTSGQSNSVISRFTFLIYKPFLKSTHKTSPHTNIKQNMHTQDISLTTANKREKRMREQRRKETRTYWEQRQRPGDWRCRGGPCPGRSCLRRTWHHTADASCRDHN